MSQCVPSWDMDDNPSTVPARLCSNSSSIRLDHNSNNNSNATDVPMLDYEVAELRWENGQLGMHAFGPPRMPLKPTGGTLESIVNQATTNNNNNGLPLPLPLPVPLPLPLVAYSSYQKQQQQQHDHHHDDEEDDVVPWMKVNRRSAPMPMDALVPNSSINNNNKNNNSSRNKKCSCCCNNNTTTTTLVGSCSADPRGLARVPSSPAWSSREQSFSTAAAAFNTNNNTAATSFENTTADSISAPHYSLQRETCDDGDDDDEDDDDKKMKKKKKKASGGHQEKSSGNSAKRSRAAAIHNQSERKRRDKINQRMKTLQKLVPNSSKTDKASMLDEVIEYLKQLQAQIQMMSRMNIPAAAPSAMMLPQLAMQQQLQMSMMAPMGMGMGLGMGMGMGMDMGRPGAPLLNPAAFMPWGDTSTTDHRLQPAPPPSVMPDPLSAFLACQSQPMTMEAYSRMAALYQQLQPSSVPNSKC